MYTLPAKSYISKCIQPILENFGSARRCWGCAFGWKVSGAQVFYIAMASWELCTSRTFEILPLSTCTLCQQKSLISKGVQPFFEIILSARRYWGCAFVLKVSVTQVFYFCSGKVKICAWTTFEILPLSTCILCQQKSCISKGIQPIYEIFASARRCWRWAFGLKVSVTQVFCFCNGKVKTCASTTFEILPLSTCTLCQQKSYISKGIQPIFEIFASARRCRGWAFGWKVSVTQVFYFCNGKVKTFESKTFEILPLSTCTLCQQKSYIIKGIQPIFEIFASARRCWGWAFEWKVSGAQVFYFCNGKVKTLPNDNIWSFATFNMYILPAKILYLQRYSTDLRNLCFSSKMLRVCIWVESFRCAGILLLQWQGENLAHRQHLIYCHF